MRGVTLPEPELLAGAAPLAAAGAQAAGAWGAAAGAAAGLALGEGARRLRLRGAPFRFRARKCVPCLAVRMVGLAAVGALAGQPAGMAALGAAAGVAAAWGVRAVLPA